MQIASDKMVFIFDLIKLYKDVPDVLDSCLTRILQSPGILKLGMRYQSRFWENQFYIFIQNLIIQEVFELSLVPIN